MEAVDWLDFGSEDFTFPGMYRAIVEDNQDPAGVGRVRVRIFGIHTFNSKNESEGVPPNMGTPVNHLPWAEPCLSMYYSGGVNLDNENLQTPNERYTARGGDKPFTLPAGPVDSLNPVFEDTTMNEYGTGGIFTVPKKGSQVWIFFENGDHTRPHYWALAPKKADWERQKVKIAEDVKVKRDNVDAWRDAFDSIVDSSEHKGSTSPASTALLNNSGKIEKPKLEIFNVDEVENYNITSYTSPGGVTHIVVNEDGLERHYIMHKGEINYMEHTGQSKRMVGNFNFQESNDSETDANDFEELIANNYELHIGGDFDTFVRKSNFVQIDGDMQVNVKKNLSFVTREGNVNVIVENGDCNVSTNSGKTNVFSQDDIQVNTPSNARIQVTGDTFLDVTGSVHINTGDVINLESLGTISIKSNQEIAFDCQKFSITSPNGFEVNAGTQFAVKPGGFGGNSTFNAPTVLASHPGCFPGPIAGGPSPFPAAPSPVTPPQPLQFQQGSSTNLEEANPPAFDEQDTQETTIPEPNTIDTQQQEATQEANQLDTDGDSGPIIG